MAESEVFLETEIGEGSFSIVYRGSWDSRPFAVKRLKPRDDGDYLREAAVLQRLNHEHIVGFYGVLRNEWGTCDFLLELGSGDTLARALHREDLRTVAKQWRTIYQISDGLTYLHGEGILHLDLKPTNILFKDHDLMQVMIADFGMATVANQARYAGAKKFKAPDFPFTRKSDVFSLASIACCILEGRNPNSREETKILVSKVIADRYPNTPWNDILRKGTSSNFRNRPGASEFRDVFRNPLTLQPRVLREAPHAVENQRNNIVIDQPARLQPRIKMRQNRTKRFQPARPVNEHAHIDAKLDDCELWGYLLIIIALVFVGLAFRN